MVSHLYGMPSLNAPSGKDITALETNIESDNNERRDKMDHAAYLDRLHTISCIQSAKGKDDTIF